MLSLALSIGPPYSVKAMVSCAECLVLYLEAVDFILEQDRLLKELVAL